jgi:chromosome segregation ATPase
MDWTAIIVAIAAALGAGGVGGAIITGLFSRQRVLAEAEAIRIKAASDAEDIKLRTQIEAFMALTERLESRIDKLHCRVEKLEGDIEGRDMIIAKLTEENRELHLELKRLKEQNERLMKTNKDLTERVQHLEVQLQGFMAGDG